MNIENSNVEKLLSFIDMSPTMFHAVENMSKSLQESGFVRLFENSKWQIKSGGKYFFSRNSSSLIAFEVGKSPIENGFRIIGTHTDSPCFKLKPGRAIITQDGYIKLNTETYGGMILSSWFDRPLSIAGRVIINKKGKICESIVDFKKPLLVIPNLCIHFNREINTGYTYNAQIDMQPLFGLSASQPDASQDCVANILKEHLNVNYNDILDYDLYLYLCEKSQVIGLNDEFISAPRLDNLWMSHAGLSAICQSDSFDGIKVLAAFDNEEVGSQTSEGAGSDFLSRILNRICQNLGLSTEETYIMFANSFAISADGAHAVHPNHAEKHDPINRPKLGEGLAIKYSASQRYATNAKTAASFIKLCDENRIKYQRFANRSDILGGSTIGPSMSSNTSIPTLDVGTALLAMHSIKELGCVADNEHAISALKCFYSNK